VSDCSRTEEGSPRRPGAAEGPRWSWRGAPQHPCDDGGRAALAFAVSGFEVGDLRSDSLRDQPEAAKEACLGWRTGRPGFPHFRKPRGALVGVVYVPAPAACVVRTGATWLPAISERAADAPPALLDRIGARHCLLTGTRPVPCETAIRRTLARFGADALGRAVGAWPADHRTRLRR